MSCACARVRSEPEFFSLSRSINRCQPLRILLACFGSSSLKQDAFQHGCSFNRESFNIYACFLKKSFFTSQVLDEDSFVPNTKKEKYATLVFHLSVSVRLSERCKVTQNKINFVKNCPQWGLNPQPLDHHSNALPTELGRNLLGRRFLK